MKSSDKSTAPNAELLAGVESLDVYLAQISRNLRSITSQVDMLETEILAIQNEYREEALLDVKDDSFKIEHRRPGAPGEVHCEILAGLLGKRRDRNRV